MAEHFGATTPLGEAQDWLFDNVDEGVPCPLCSQFTKVYRRKITAPMALGLIRWRQRTGFQENHVSLVADVTHEFSQLSWWDLVMEVPVGRDDGGKAGRWILTTLGDRFAQDLVLLPKYARIFDGGVLGLVQDETVGIRDALGTKFNYDDLMRGV